MKHCPGERMVQGNTSCRLLCFRMGILGQTSWRGGAQGYQAGKVPGQVMFLRGACTCPAWSAPFSRICCSSASLFQLQSSASAPSSLWISPAVLFPSAGTIASGGATSFMEKALLCQFDSISGPSQLALPCPFALKPSATRGAASFCSIWATPYNSISPAFKSAP